MNQHRNLLTATGLLLALAACSPSGGGSTPTPTPTPTDTVAPTISLGASSTNFTAAGNLTLTANASDNVGVTKVEFFDGATKLGEDTSAPYTQTVSFTAANNGSKSYTAKAFDAAGNTKTSSAVAVTVAIVVDTTRPTLQSSSVLSNTSVRLAFSEPILGGNVAANFRLRLSDLVTPLAVTAASVGVDGKTITLTTAAQTKDEQYLLFIDNITDLAGNPFDQTNSPSLAFTIIGVGP